MPSIHKEYPDLCELLQDLLALEEPRLTLAKRAKVAGDLLRVLERLEKLRMEGNR